MIFVARGTQGNSQEKPKKKEKRRWRFEHFLFKQRPRGFVYMIGRLKPAAHERKPPREAASSAMHFHSTRWENYSTTT
jgi:hypothetical protein